MKKNFKGLFLSLFLAMVLITNIMIKPNCVEASAASTSKYILNMDYTETYSSYGMNTPVTTTGTSTTLTYGGYNKRTLELFIYSSAYNSTIETANSGHLFNFNDITIELETDYTIQRKNKISSYSIRNVNGTVVENSTTASQPTTLFSGKLDDGSYFINLVWDVDDYLTTYPNYTKQSATFSITYSFQVDGNAPIITGASTSKDYYENSDFEVMATDSGSGLKNLYIKNPVATEFSACPNPCEITNGINGLYSFYAVDNSGNKSEIHYVYYDETPPTGSVKNSSGITLTTAYTNAQFIYSCTDNDSGIDSVEWKTPMNNTWQDYPTEVSNLVLNNGTYYFRCKDKAGNYSLIKTINYDTKAPTMSFYNENGNITNGAKVSCNYISYTADGTGTGIKSTYVLMPGATKYVLASTSTKYLDSGTYFFYCYDYAGNRSSTYSVTLDNAAPILTAENATFGSATQNEFRVIANDDSTCELYCKGPNDYDYRVLSQNYIDITYDMPEGKYYFYAEDEFRNRSEEMFIEFIQALPEIVITYDDDTNCYTLTWFDNTYTVGVNGVEYFSGGKLTAEGDYEILVIANNGKRNTYNITINHKWIITGWVEATCLSEGYSINECLTCDGIIYGDWTGIGDHRYIEKKVVEPTCSSQGYTLYFCDYCFNEWKGNYIDTLPHDYKKTDIKASCMNKGYTHYECLECGYSYDDEYTGLESHDYKITSKKGSCEEEGTITYKCNLCGYTYSESVGYGSHSYITTIIAPTCINKGYAEYKCSLCGNTYYDNYVSATGHNYEKTVIEATCINNGYTEYECSYCGASYQTNQIPAIGHKYIETNREPTCTKSGGTFYSCLFCSSEYQTNEILPVGHSYETEIIKNSDCINEGKRRYYCSKCGEGYEIIIPATGHNYQLVKEINKNGTVERTYKCSECGDTYSELLGDQYDKVATYIISLVNKYNPYIVYVFTTTACVWSIGMGVAYAVAQKNEDKVKAKKMLVNYIIGIVTIFVILVALPYLVKGIAILLS